MFDKHSRDTFALGCKVVCVIDGQELTEAHIRRLIRRVQNLTTALIAVHAELNRARQDIRRLELELDDAEALPVYRITPKGYDYLRDHERA